MSEPSVQSAFLEISPAVMAARQSGQPVVALESTIISHGMPPPRNIETALAVEEIIRRAGACPATIAVLDGKVRIGLEAPDFERLSARDQVAKLSRGDLAYALTAGQTGATTVAATMICAHHAGIRVFATGGIGGVHKGGQDSLDISADLEELARTPVAVVCAGIKAILDLRRTLEVLETKGVPVITYNEVELPSFWSRQSGVLATQRLDTPDQVASFLRCHFELAGGGALIANPPNREDEISTSIINQHIEEAAIAAENMGIKGKHVTPFMLDFILQGTEGRSLETNIALIKNNARLAAEIAISLSATTD